MLFEEERREMHLCRLNIKALSRLLFEEEGKKHPEI